MAERDRFETDLADALRTYAESAPTRVRPAELARHFATAYPHRRTLFGAWRPIAIARPSAVARFAWLLLLLAGLLAATVGGMLIVGSQPERDSKAVLPPIGELYTCPPGSTPDEPGPVDQARPPSGPMAFDRASGKIVLVGLGGGSSRGETWTFDVCTNTWEAMHPASEPSVGFMGMLAYDAAVDRTISMNRSGEAWAYDLTSNTWTRLASVTSDTWTMPYTTSVGEARLGGARLAYDSGAAEVVALHVEPPHLMWSFDGADGAWEQIDRDQVVWLAPSGTDAHILLAYDASVDRLVGYEVGEVRLFDRRTGTWSPPGTTSPPFGYGGYFSLGGEIAYDEAARRTVLFSLGLVIAYDATADEWETLYGPPADGCGIRPECRSQPFTVYDPINERIVVYGGNVHTGAVDPGWWGPSDDVLAFDTHTREWTVLLEATEGQHAPSPG